MKLRFVAVAWFLLAAAGCGQKGPLYLPGDPSEGRILLPTEELPGGNDADESGVEDVPADPTGPEEPPVEDDEQSAEQ